MSVLFSISGFSCSHDDITDLIGFEPTEISRIGDPITPGNVKLCKSNFWRFRIDNESLALDHQMNELLKALTDTNRVNRAIDLGEGIIKAVLYCSDRSADLYLSMQTIRSLAKINCDFEMDYYIVPNDEETEI